MGERRKIAAPTKINCNCNLSLLQNSAALLLINSIVLMLGPQLFKAHCPLPSAARLRPSVTGRQLQLARKGFPALNCLAGARNDELNHGIGGWHLPGDAVASTSAPSAWPCPALPHSQAARDSESHHHDQAPARSMTSFDDDDVSRLALEGQFSMPDSSRKLKYKTIMLKVSGEALQVGCFLLTSRQPHAWQNPRPGHTWAHGTHT